MKVIFRLKSRFDQYVLTRIDQLLLPKFSRYLLLEQRQEVVVLVQRVIELLGSPEIAVDERHGPKLYARSLSRLLAVPAAKAAMRPGPRNRPLSADFTTSHQPVISQSLGTGSPLSAGTHASYFDFANVLRGGSPGTTPEIAPVLVPGFSSILDGAYTTMDAFAPTATGGLLAPPGWVDWSTDVGFLQNLQAGPATIDPQTMQSMHDMNGSSMNPFPGEKR